jgi:hypothetical protein
MINTASFDLPEQTATFYEIWDEIIKTEPRRANFRSYTSRQEAQAFIDSLYADNPSLTPGYVVRVIQEA